MDIVMSIREENNAVGEEQSNMGGACCRLDWLPYQ